MKKYKCKFKKNQLVKFYLPNPNYSRNFPFKENEILLFLGEIKQMPGHCIIVNRRGSVYWGYHTDNFIEPSEDDI
jgi:hypothetical protein